MKRRFDSSLINFLKDLKAFHSSTGNSIVSFPCISGHNVNLYKLYKIVSANGGFDKVSVEDKWPLILEELNIPEECANASEVIKQIYQRYLERYERSRKNNAPGVVVDFDGDEAGDDNGTRFTPMYKSRRSDFDPRSMISTDTSRSPGTIMHPMPPNFSRLYKSLLCGLPNEFDLGVSACLALSLHDNRIPLLPSHFGLFIDLLCAHAGIFGDDETQLSQLYYDWRKSDGLRFFDFWSEHVQEEPKDGDALCIKDLLYSPCVSHFLQEELFRSSDPTFENLKLPLSCKEGFIVELVASVFRNLSFDAYNAVLMSSNNALLRFLFLGAHCCYRNISTLCLDTFARLAPTLTIAALDLIIESGSTLLIDFVRRLLNSTDRAQVLAGAEILASLCQNDSNFDELCSFVDSSLCNRLFQCLLVPDIHLVVNCAEAIYQISELGPSSCDVIAANERHLIMVLALATIEAVAFGPDAIVNIKVVAQHGPGMVPTQTLPQSSFANPLFRPRHFQQIQNNARIMPQPCAAPPMPTLNYPPQAPSHIQVVFAFASSWIRGIFEPDTSSGCEYSVMDIFNEYLGVAARNGKPAFDSPDKFAECLCRNFAFATIKSPPPGKIETAKLYGVRRTLPVVGTSSCTAIMPNSMAPPVGVAPNVALNNSGPSLPVQQKVQILPKPPLPEFNISVSTSNYLPNGSKDGNKTANTSNISVEPGDNSSVLGVVGAPMAAADMIDGERRQHELAITRVENRPVSHLNNGVVEKPVCEPLTNGTKDSDDASDKNSTLAQLLDSNEDNVKDGKAEEDFSTTFSNGSSNEVAQKGVAKVSSGEELKEKPSNRSVMETPYVNGFVHSTGQLSENNGYHSETKDRHASVDEASVVSADSTSRSAAVFASCDSESLVSMAGGDTSRMSAVSELDNRDANSNRRLYARSCPSVSNNDSRSGAGMNAALTNHVSVGSHLRIPGSVSESENSAPLNTGYCTREQNTPYVSQENQPFPCLWNNCTEGFASADSLHRHFVGTHVPQIPGVYGGRFPCLWLGCAYSISRLKWSLVSHIKEHHLALKGSDKARHLSRQTHPDCEIPPDAGLRAVLTNFCLTTSFQPPAPGFEGPVTKQLRLAGGLILRNLAKHSANGKRFIHRHLHELVAIAFSGIESSAALSAALDFADQPLL